MQMEFGTRVIQKINYTYTVSLPPVWVRDRRLKKGSKLELKMTGDGDLVLTPHIEKESKEDETIKSR